jgi:hypothetical protein
MYDPTQNNWLYYLETPRRASSPVKLDQILTERMEAFLRARRVKPFRTRLPF